MKIEIYVNINKSGYGFCNLKTPFQNSDPYITEGYRLFKVVTDIPIILIENVNVEKVEEINNEN